MDRLRRIERGKIRPEIEKGKELFQDLPVKDGRVLKCTVVFPAQGVKLTSDAPLIGVYSLLCLGAVIIIGLCSYFGRRGDTDTPIA